MKKPILLFAMLLPFFVFSQNPSITGITPNSALQGQTLSLTISGNNMNFTGASSCTGNLAGFRFSAGGPTFTGVSTSTTGNDLYGRVSVPASQPTGPYTLEVEHCGPFGFEWISQPFAFVVNAPSWNCIGGACVDPGNGNGQYSLLSNCLTACGVTPSWDCDDGVCTDPGDGSGAYPNYFSCDAVCDPNAINEEISGLLIYPNPAKNTLTIDGNYTSATIYNVVGKVVLATDYQKTIDLTALSNGIYFIHINTKDAMTVTVKKITIAK